MKQKLLLLLSVLLAFGQNAFAYDFSYTYQGKTLYYTIRGNGVYVANPMTGNNPIYVAGNVVIPDSVEYNDTVYAVTSIGSYAFQHCNGLTSVTIPNSVTSIGYNAFDGCSGLTSVTIPSSVTSISNFAFWHCFGLTSIVVEAGNTHYDSRDSCNAIIQTDLNQLIQGCNSTVIPNSVTSIKSYAFNGFSGLTSVTIPNMVTSIGGHAFEGCSGLTSVIIPDSVTTIGWDAFYGCSGLTSLSIGGSVTSIGVGAFSGCSGLTTVTIPSSVTSIGTNAFSGCSGLTSMYCEPTTPPTFDSGYHLGDINYRCPIYVPCGSVSAYQNTAGWENNYSQIQGYVNFNYSFVPNNEAFGTVNVGSPQCGDSATVTVTATPSSDYRFAGWSDGSTDNPRTVELTGDTTVVAYFEYNSYTLTVLPNDSTLGSVTGSGTYTYGTEVTVTASAAPGNRFDRWDDNTLLASYTFTITANRTLIAVFMPTDTVFVHDTTIVHDTTLVTDTIIVTDTLWMTDTVYIHDTIYVDQQGIDPAGQNSIMLYAQGGQIVVERAMGEAVRLYDLYGRLIADRRDTYGQVRFDITATGAYMVKVGDRPARKIVVVR